jgi:hypothetical protein
MERLSDSFSLSLSLYFAPSPSPASVLLHSGLLLGKSKLTYLIFAAGILLVSPKLDPIQKLERNIRYWFWFVEMGVLVTCYFQLIGSVLFYLFPPLLVPI